jgi:hypothetical protein
MITKLGFVVLVLAAASALLVAAQSAQGAGSQSARAANAYVMRMDRCPYYPSRVACRVESGTRTTQTAAKHNV